MTFLRDRSIGIKVLIPPLILIAALGVVVLLAVYGLDRQHDALTAVDDLALDKITLVDEFIALSEQVQSDVFRIFVLRSMALPAAEIQPVHARLQQGLSDLGVIYGEILTRWPLDPTERALLERMKGPLDAFSVQARQAALVVTDNPSFGVLLVRSSTVPFAEFRGILAEFLNYQQAKIVRATAAANQAADRTRNLLLAVALGTALLATLAAMLISVRTISRPVQAITALMHRLAAGDLAIEPRGLARRDEIGAMARAVEVFRNNAIAQARLDGALRASEERYRLIFHHSPVGILHYDTQLRITDCNERLATILHSTRWKIIGLEMTRLSDQSVLPALRQALTGEDGFYEGFYAATTSPARVWGTLRTAPLLDSHGTIQGGVGLAEDITERKRAEEALLERVRLTTLAVSISDALTRGAALPEMLQQCAELLVRHLDLAFARIWTLDPTANVLELQTSAGMYTHTDGQHRRIPVGQHKIGRIAQERQSYRTNQVIGDPSVDDQAWAQREGLVAFAGYPLIAEGRLVGVIAMFARHPLTDSAFEMLALIVDGVALGIEEKRSQETLHRQNAYLTALQETSLDLISQLDLDTLLENIVKRAGQFMGTSSGYLGLVEPGSGQLNPQVGLGALAESLKFQSKPGEGLAGTVWLTGKPLVLEDYDAWAGRIGAFRHNAIRATIGVPLMAGAEVLGVLGLAYDATTTRTFEPEAAELLGQFARFAAIAIENARLYTTAQAELAARQRAEAALRVYSTQLEDRVAARTQELVMAQERLVRQERLAVLGQLAGGVAHELRNPLGTIKNVAYLLRITLADPAPTTREALAILDRQVRTSNRIISNMLDFARARYPSLRATDVNAVIEQALAQVAVPPTVQVVRRLDTRLPLIQADTEQLAQVFENLLSNAVQAMPAGGELVIISEPTPPPCQGGGDDASPLLAGEGSGVRLTIRDTGSGIASEHLDRIFDPLFTTKAKGIGLGLALVKMLVEGHGGSIQVTSEEGRGAAFTVTLPTG